MKSVFDRIHVPSAEGKTYLDWLEEAVSFCHCTGQPKLWQKRAEKALRFCRDLFEKYPDRVLLHGDLHHDNLLQNSRGRYTAIDPKGIIGPEILDLPRFMLNELDTLHLGSDRDHVWHVLHRISGMFGYSFRDLVKCFWMEVALANIWRMEDGISVSEREMEVADLLMEENELLERWKAEEAAAHIHGWDFSRIEGRYMEEDDLLWDYRAEILKHLKPEMKLLDIDTGGGEFLLSLGHPCENTAATENYGPNVALCRETLLPMGIDFRAGDGKGMLPFGNETFDMVIDRHGDFNAEEIYRVLKPEGLFITQQVGAENDRELVELLLGETPIPFPEQYLDITAEKFRSAGFEILEGKECFCPIYFYDVGALVWFARIIEWEFPGFSVEGCFESLIKAQRILQQKGTISGEIHRFFLCARKNRQ